MRRLYSLESATGLVHGVWVGLPGLTNMANLSGSTTVTSPAPPGAVFYRGKVWLEP